MKSLAAKLVVWLVSIAVVPAAEPAIVAAQNDIDAVLFC
jgi:hypothetical protein